jgi:hypothetical protein
VLQISVERGAPGQRPANRQCALRRHSRLDVVADPLAGTVVVPGEGETLGISRQRKWAAAKRGVELLKRWLLDRGSRNLVYPAG